MTRHVLALAVALCASTSTVSAQAPAPLDSQLTVKTTPAELHKSPTVASTVIGKAQIGTVLDVRRKALQSARSAMRPQPRVNRR